MLDITRLKELNQALKENLISQEEYEELKKNILNQSTQTIPSYDPSQILGVSGSIILFLGIFAPIVAAPVVGNINLSNTENGFIFVVLAIGSLICSIVKKYKLLWITGISSLALIALVTINILNKAEAIESLDTLELDNLLFQPQWGLAIIIIGSILIIAAAYRQHHQKTKEKIIKSIRNAVAYILLFSSIEALFDTISYLITDNSYFDYQEIIVIAFMIVSGFFLLTKDNQNTPFFKNFISIVIGYRCLTHLQYKDFFMDFVFIGAILVLQYEKAMKLNKHLNEKARKRRFKKKIIKS